MTQAPPMLTPWLPHSPGRHLAAASLAVFISVALHVLVLRVLPPLPVGRPPRVKSQTPMAAIRMQDVRRNDRDVVMRPEVFRPENPEEFVDMSVPAEKLREEFQAALPETPNLEAGPLTGEQGALAEPAPPASRSAWEPRQEILKIEQKIYADDISALPRRYDVTPARAAIAPDITLPAELDKAEWAGALQAAELASAAGSLRQDMSRARWPGGGAAAGAGSGAPPLQEASRFLDESPDEITALQPVEQLLDLKVFTQRSESEPDSTYFKIVIQRRGAEKLPVLAKDVLLIQDCSESMTQRKLNECKRGLESWLEVLGPDDRFDIMGFRDNVYRCFGAWTNVTASTRSRANWFIEDMVSRGRTDVYESLHQLLGLERATDRPLLAVLVTDGRPTMGLVDSSEIIETFSQQNQGGVSVFAFGGGQRVNRFLLDLLSYKNRGESLLVPDRDDIPAGLRQWAVELSRPVLVNLTYRFAGLEESEIYPRSLTHLYLDRPLVLYGRTRGTPGRVIFQIVGESGPDRHDMVFTMDWDQARPGGESLRSEWAWQKVYHLIGEHIKTGQPGIMAEIHSLENQYGFLVPYGGELPTRF